MRPVVRAARNALAARRARMTLLCARRFAGLVISALGNREMLVRILTAGFVAAIALSSAATANPAITDPDGRLLGGAAQGVKMKGTVRNPRAPASGGRVRDQGKARHRHRLHQGPQTLLRARQQSRDPLRGRRRPRRLHLERYPHRLQQARMAGLAAAAGNAEAPARSSASHEGRPGQSARRARALYRLDDLSHPRHARSRFGRRGRLVGLHPPEQ